MKLNDIIARIFWPKEMRELVEKYRAEGTLNEQAIEHFSQYTAKYTLCAIASALVLVFFEPIISALIILLLPVDRIFHSKRHFQKLFFPYTTGDKIEVKILGLHRGIYRGTKSVSCETLEKPTQKLFIVFTISPTSQEMDLFKPEDVISVYRSKSPPCVMPDIEPFKSRYCLNKQLL